MRHVTMLLLVLPLACKRQPDALFVSGGYFDPITHFDLSTVRLMNGAAELQVVEGTLSVAVRPAAGGPALCEGKVELTKSAYQPRYGDQKPEASANVAMSKGTCPSPEKNRYVVVTTLTRKDGVPPSVDESSLDGFTLRTPEDAVSASVLSGCSKKALAEVKAAREQVRPALEAGIKAYAPPLQHAVAALLAKDDPCERVLDVYAGPTEFAGSMDWSEHYLASRSTFDDLVRAQDWPFPSVVGKELAGQLSKLGGGWLSSSFQTGSPTGNAVTVSYRVGSSGAVTIFELPLPALYLSGEVRVVVPDAVDESVSLGDAQFEATGQQVKYADLKRGGQTIESGAAAAAVRLMATDLVARFKPWSALRP